MASAARHGQARDFRKAACDQRCGRIGSQSQSIGHACSDRNDVFRGGADFHADDIEVCIEAKPRSWTVRSEAERAATPVVKPPPALSGHRERLQVQTSVRKSPRFSGSTEGPSTLIITCDIRISVQVSIPLWR